MWKLYVFYLVIVTNSLMAHKRKLSTNINPGCINPECDIKQNTSTALLIHIRADGDLDTLHHIWDFSEIPSLLIVRTDQNTTLNVTWDKYLKKDGISIKFSSPPLYVFGILIDKIFEFNDTDNIGMFNITDRRSDYVHLMDTKDFHWKLGSQPKIDNETTLVPIEGRRHDHHHNSTGIIRIWLGAYGGEKHDSALPHLLYSSNSSQVEIALDNMPTRYEHSRFGLGIVTLTSDPTNSSMKLNVRKSLDDEHDPGVFNIIEITSPEVTEEPKSDIINGGYLQWRPVVYTTQNRDATNSVDSLQYGISPVSDIKLMNKTIFHKLFDDKLNEYLISTTNITFGAAGDKFYKKTGYATWTFVAGIGRPVEETFSMLVIMILVIGLGLPVVLIVFGVLCVMVRRILKNKDDLFLSQ